MFADSIWTWSLRLFRFRGITVRAHWTLFLIALFDMVQWMKWFWGSGTFALLLAPVLTVVLFGSILLHEFGHAFAARAKGGHCDRIVLWMLGGLAECEVPMRPGAQFACAGAGPLVSLLLCLSGLVAFGVILQTGWGTIGSLLVDAVNPFAWNAPLTLFAALETTDHVVVKVAGGLAWYAFWVNSRLLLFNLLPCYPLDGGRMFLSAAWPLFGLRRAMTATLVIGYPLLAALLGWAIFSSSFFLLLIGIWLLSALIQEHAQLRMYNSVAFGLDLAYDRAPSWWDRSQRDRHRQRADARARAEEDEQQRIDQLLEKVGRLGLPSLTRHERAVLDAYARKERDRLGAGK